MTNQMESAQPVSPATTPTAAGGAASGQATSPDIGAVLARLEKAEQELKGLQSIGDKRDAKTNEKFATVQDYLQRAGLKVDERVLRDMQVDEILASRNSQQTVSPGSGAPLPTPQPSEQVDYLAPIKAVGLDANDPEVLKLTVQHGSQPDIFKLKLLDLATARKSAPPASLAAAAPGYNPVGQSTTPDISGLHGRALLDQWEGSGAKVPTPKG